MATATPTTLPSAGTTFHVWVVLLGQRVLAAYTTPAGASSSHHARTEDAKIPPSPVLAIAATDGRVFLLGDEVAFDGKLADNDEAVVGRALDKMDPVSRAAIDRQRPRAAPRPRPQREPKPGDPDYVSDANWPK